ncbi:circularly permuted type 2 ATP-grasp protein [Propionibacteriaceae bacterium G1746]
MSVEELDWDSSPLAPYAELVSHGEAWDEVIGAEGVRDPQRILSSVIESSGLTGLLSAAADARRLVHEDGVHYGGTLNPNRWKVDPLPMVVDADEWQQIERGVAQRLTVLNLLVADIYGDQLLIRQGVLPAEVVLGHPEFLPQAHGVPFAGGPQLNIVGTDLGRDAEGLWHVLDDRTAAPSGAGYAMVNRRITSRVMADLHRGTRLRRLRGFFQSMRQSLLDAAPQTGHMPRGALLWSGSASETAYEQGFLATLLGYSLVEADDLTVRDAALWVLDDDRRTRVDVLLRRVDSVFCDPLEFRPDSQLGVAGLLEASRQGNLTIANRLGSGVLENPALNLFLPRVARELLGEDLLLPPAPTWWCGDPTQLDHVVTHLDELVIKPIHRTGAGAARAGWTLSRTDRESIVRQLRQQPWAWVGQDPVMASTTPVVTPEGLVPRRTVLRTFAVAEHGGYTLMPGGLARVAPSGDAWRISSGSGALTKDVWVLEADDTVPGVLTRPVGHEPMLWVEGRDQQPLPNRVADNLFWYGRYTERVESTSRLLRTALDLSEDYGNRVGTMGYQVLQLVGGAVASMTAMPWTVGTDRPAESSRQLLRRAATDPGQPGSLAHDIDQLERAAHEVPDMLSMDVWPLISQLGLDMARASDELDLTSVVGATQALAGINGESMMRDHTWAFIDAGTRIERATNTLWLLGEVFAADLSMSVEDLVAESVLAVCESLISHHRGQALGTLPPRPLHAAMALLVLEPNNPRSVCFQWAKLERDLVLIGDDHAAARTRALRERVQGEAPLLRSGSWQHISDVLVGAADDTRDLSDAITRRHFQRPAPRVFRQTGWFNTVEPRLRG